MLSNHPEMLPILDGIAPPTPAYGEAGYVERALAKQVEAMTLAGSLTVEHAGAIALAMTAARQVDNISLGGGRPSGRAMMLTAATKVFELLPDVAAVSEDKWADLMREIKKNDPQEVTP